MKYVIIRVSYIDLLYQPFHCDIDYWAPGFRKRSLQTSSQRAEASEQTWSLVMHRFL